jgi:hypothetical protein
MSIRLYWQGGERGEINFGDSISPLLVSALSGREVVYGDIYNCELAAVGSILDKIVAKQWKRLLRLKLHTIKIWGSGSFGPDRIARYGKLDIFAVRGPLTRDAMGLNSSMVLGDPGLLVDRLISRPEKVFRWGIIPHVVDREHGVVREMNLATPHSCVINLADPDLLATARTIASCDYIISSSLHGLIAADSFGIPSLWMRLSGDVFGGDWKFHDYFQSVGRSERVPVAMVADLRTLEPLAAVADRKTIDQRKQGLEEAFRGMGI